MIENLSYLTSKLRAIPIVNGVMLYGSAARDELDSFSDIDLLVSTSVEDLRQFERIKNEIASSGSQSCINKISVGIYSSADLELMYKSNSLFILHLQKEGVSLFEESNALKFKTRPLVNYRNFQRDILIYLRACADIERELTSIPPNSINVCYELSVLGSIVRNACIAFCAHNQCPSFSRFSVYEVAVMKVGVRPRLGFDEYKELCLYRKYFEQNAHFEVPVSIALSLQRKVFELLMLLKGVSHEF